MGVVSKVKVSKEVSDYSFPVIMENIDYKGLVVLFTNYREGTVLSKGDGEYPVGLCVDTWCTCSDKTTWKVLEGEIILSNQP